MTIQMKSTEQYFPTALSVMLYKVADLLMNSLMEMQPFKSRKNILLCLLVT